MASPTTPTHGKDGAIYRQRPNNFKGNGLNDVTWGTGFNGAASAYFEVVIDHNGLIKTVTLGAGGTGYTVDDVLTVVQAGGSGGTVTVTSVNAGVITGISLTTKGAGYSVADGLAVTGGTGADATVNITAISDSFKWRKDGGAWTEDVAITGAAQTLSDGQTITFAAVTGHTITDQWTIGNLKDEACTESGADAQITDATKRLISPNSPPTFTDSGGKNILTIDYTQGKATFDGNVTIVTVTGNNGFIVESGLEKVGYLIDWDLDPTVDLIAAPRKGQKWKEWVVGQAQATGKANRYFIGKDSFFPSFEDGVDGTQKYFLLQLFNYDPDQDQTGDHFIVWAIFTSLNVSAPIGEVVKEPIGFTLQGIPSFKANA